MTTRKRSRAKRAGSRRRAPSKARRKLVARTSRAVSRKRKAAPKRPAPGRAAAAPARAPSAIGLHVQHIDYTSQAMDEVRRFYTELLGFKQFVYDPKMSYLFVTTGPSSSLGFMPPMQGSPEQWRPPREPALYFLVKDVDHAYGELASRGVSFDHPPQDMAWGHRVAVLKDPEGRRVCLAQQMKR